MLARVKAAGFSSVSELCESSPHATLVQLVDQLNNSDTEQDPRPNTADQVAQLWKREAIAAGPGAIERLARRSLVGEMHDILPRGWPADLTDDAAFPLSEIWATWSGILPEEWEEAGFAVWRGIQTLPPPAGWLPQSTRVHNVAFMKGGGRGAAGGRVGRPAA